MGVPTDKVTETNLELGNLTVGDWGNADERDAAGRNCRTERFWFPKTTPNTLGTSRLSER